MKYPILLIICASLILQACKSFVSPAEVNPFYAPEAYSSFGLSEPIFIGLEEGVGPEDQDQLIKLIYKDMQSRRYVESPDPDIWIQVRVEIEERKISDQPFPNENKWEEIWGVPKHVRTGDFLEGKVEIQAIDAKTKLEIWKGKGKKLIEKEHSKKELKLLKTEVKSILKTFPYRARKIHLTAPASS